MGEPLRVALAVVMLVCGWALIIYAGHLHYVALPGDHAPRREITRAAVAVVGIVVVLLGSRFLR